MDRVIATNTVAVGSGDTVPSGTPGQFTSGNPLTSTPATVLPGYWCNMITEELRNVVVAANLTPSGATLTQLQQALQGSLAAAAAVNVAGGSNVTLSFAQYSCGTIVLSGAITANIAVIFPTNGKWAVENNTTGSFTVNCKTAAGSGVIVAQGATGHVAGDGTNIVGRNMPTTVGASGAPLLSSGSGTSPMTYGTVTGLGNFVLSSGGTLNAPTLTGASVVANIAALQFSSVNCPNNTATTIVAFSGLAHGFYKLYLTEDGAANRTAMAELAWDGTTLSIISQTNNGASLTFSVSSTNLQVTQTTGSSQTCGGSAIMSNGAL